MLLNLSLIKCVLNDHQISGSFLERETGLSKSTISKYRTNKLPLENMTLSTLLKLHHWAENEYKIDWKKTAILKILKEDIEEENIIQQTLTVKEHADFLQRYMPTTYFYFNDVNRIKKRKNNVVKLAKYQKRKK